MEKEIKIENKIIKIHEMKYLDFVSSELKQDKKEKQIQLFELHGVSREITESLNFKEGNEIAKVINELDGFGEDFQKPPINEKKK